MPSHELSDLRWVFIWNMTDLQIYNPDRSKCAYNFASNARAND